jgi:hypothetical protein
MGPDLASHQNFILKFANEGLFSTGSTAFNSSQLHRKIRGTIYKCGVYGIAQFAILCSFSQYLPLPHFFAFSTDIAPFALFTSFCTVLHYFGMKISKKE